MHEFDDKDIPKKLTDRCQKLLERDQTDPRKSFFAIFYSRRLAER